MCTKESKQKSPYCNFFFTFYLFRGSVKRALNCVFPSSRHENGGAREDNKGSFKKRVRARESLLFPPPSLFFSRVSLCIHHHVEEEVGGGGGEGRKEIKGGHRTESLFIHLATTTYRG